MAYSPSSGGPPAWTPRSAWGPQGIPPPDTREFDLHALSKIWIAALISVVGSALGVAVPFGLSSSGYFPLTIPTTGGTLSFGSTTLLAVFGVALVGLALSMVAFGFYRAGFVTLRGVDLRFSSAPTWALLVIVGLVVVWLGLLLALSGLLQLVSCTGATSPIPASCIPFGAVLGGAALLLVGAILLLVGYIGTLVAIWHLGDRYGESLFKIGAVLLIIPFLSIVGQILILVAASRVETHLRQRPVYPLAPSVGYPPPPAR